MIFIKSKGSFSALTLSFLWQQKEFTLYHFWKKVQEIYVRRIKWVLLMKPYLILQLDQIILLSKWKIMVNLSKSSSLRSLLFETQ